MFTRRGPAPEHRPPGSEGRERQVHRHTHGAIDPTMFASRRGIWAVKWSFAVLLATAAFQVGIVLLSGSVALLADTIHNFGDAVTAIPLWVAFSLARLHPGRRFTYGYGRVEDLAGVFIVLVILVSAGVVAYESVTRIFDTQDVDRDSPDQTNFPGYSSFWDTVNYNPAFQGRQMRPDSLKFPVFI